MSNSFDTPVALFAYARPDTLGRLLECLRGEGIPLLYVFCDAPARAELTPAVEQVRKMVHAIDWCTTRVIERKENLGLGKSIRAGVETVLQEHASILVFEDDLICVPGTYAYLATALQAYRDDSRVMSVTGWSHPTVAPQGIGDQPYFDGRSDSWLWGGWRRSWEGMDMSALQMIRQCRRRGIDPRAYGCDLYRLAKYEEKGNTWAVRFMYNHIRNRSLCMRPPHSLVEHVGFGEGSVHITGAKQEKWAAKWGNPPLRSCPPIPAVWPEPVEDPSQRDKWQEKCGRYAPQSLWQQILSRLGSAVRL
jgi:hypothetical protein